MNRSTMKAFVDFAFTDLEACGATRLANQAYELNFRGESFWNSFMEPSGEQQAQAKLARHTTGSAGSVGPVDRAHLARYTLGNTSLELEVLQLFAGQAPTTLAELRGATCARSWYVAAHTLKGSARAVGAHAVAKTAEIAEAAGYADPRRAELIAAIEASIEEARSYISRLPSA